MTSIGNYLVRARSLRKGREHNNETGLFTNDIILGVNPCPKAKSDHYNGITLDSAGNIWVGGKVDRPMTNVGSLGRLVLQRNDTTTGPSGSATPLGRIIDTAGYSNSLYTVRSSSDENNPSEVEYNSIQVRDEDIVFITWVRHYTTTLAVSPTLSISTPTKTIAINTFTTPRTVTLTGLYMNDTGATETLTFSSSTLNDSIDWEQVIISRVGYKDYLPIS